MKTKTIIIQGCSFLHFENGVSFWSQFQVAAEGTAVFGSSFVSSLHSHGGYRLTCPHLKILTAKSTVFKKQHSAHTL